MDAIDQDPERDAHHGVERRESEAQEQAHLRVADAEVGLDRLDQEREDAAVEEGEDDGEGHHRHHPPRASAHGRRGGGEVGAREACAVGGWRTGWVVRVGLPSCSRSSAASARETKDSSTVSDSPTVGKTVDPMQAKERVREHVRLRLPVDGRAYRRLLLAHPRDAFRSQEHVDRPGSSRVSWRVPTTRRRGASTTRSSQLLARHVADIVYLPAMRAPVSTRSTSTIR